MKFFLTCLFTFFFVTSFVYSKGDLSIRSKKLELKLGSDKSDYEIFLQPKVLITKKILWLNMANGNLKIFTLVI